VGKARKERREAVPDAMRFSVLNDRTPPIPPDGSQPIRYQDSTISARNSLFPARSGRIPSWQLFRILPALNVRSKAQI